MMQPLFNLKSTKHSKPNYNASTQNQALFILYIAEIFLVNLTLKLSYTEPFFHYSVCSHQLKWAVEVGTSLQTHNLGM